MLDTEDSNAQQGGPTLLRNEPVQARSSARLTALLDAAAVAVDEVGFERLTTAMVAERAGASIGTVYRYFPDRIAVVEALALRCTQRLAARFIAAVDDSAVVSWESACESFVDATVDMYRMEPGFRAVQFGDATGVLGEHDRMTALGETVGSLLHGRFGLPVTDDTMRAWAVVMQAGHGVLARANAGAGAPDEAVIAEFRIMSVGYLRSVFSRAE